MGRGKGGRVALSLPSSPLTNWADTFRRQKRRRRRRRKVFRVSPSSSHPSHPILILGRENGVDFVGKTETSPRSNLGFPNWPFPPPIPYRQMCPPKAVSFVCKYRGGRGDPPPFPHSPGVSMCVQSARPSNPPSPAHTHRLPKGGRRERENVLKIPTESGGRKERDSSSSRPPL